MAWASPGMMAVFQKDTSQERMFQEPQQELSYHLGSGLLERPFCHILLVRHVTQASPV